jgi:hypothetical protein
MGARPGADVPVQQGTPSYPHLWISLCVSEAFACVR